MQEFNAIQILIAHLNSELFHKIYVVQFCSIDTKITVFFKAAFIISAIKISELECDFVWISDNPNYQYRERHIIHLLASGYQTIKKIEKKNLFLQPEKGNQQSLLTV
ncbi:hypothetical protein RF11_14980 [Thelohanellus kitauei]|uniref:Uncharacterized protein n=1 Tax=Thelohanellus kitauei TaxID=669202 RepID=A0A0C2J4H8_THEKT|nr:hypothetical protein RF11_14980 [Thelohanellus kitauei]